MNLALLGMVSAVMAPHSSHYVAGLAGTMHRRPAGIAIRPKGLAACAIVRAACPIV